VPTSQGRSPVRDVEKHHIGHYRVEGSANVIEAGEVAPEVPDPLSSLLFKALGVGNEPRRGLHVDHLCSSGSHQPAQVALAAAGVEDPPSCDVAEQPDSGVSVPLRSP
jgi:hypothetical protein